MSKRQTKPDLPALYRIAEAQAGYFAAAQAVQAGFQSKLLWHYRKSRRLLQVAHGIYRLTQFPASPFEDLFAAWLRCGSKAVISHESALAVYDLTDVIPGEVHVTVPRTASRRRRGIRLHTAAIGKRDIKWREGLPVTSVARTISALARAGLEEERVREAIRQALKRGLTDRKSLLAEARRRGGRAARLIGQQLSGPGAR